MQAIKLSCLSLFLALHFDNAKATSNNQTLQNKPLKVLIQASFVFIFEQTLTVFRGKKEKEEFKTTEALVASLSGGGLAPLLI